MRIPLFAALLALAWTGGVSAAAKRPIANSPNSNEKVELGKQLFFDKRLSKDGTVSCASCHDPKKAWSNGEPVATGIAGQKGDRNVPVVFNREATTFQFWDGRAPSLEEQVVFPLTDPKEMGNSIDQTLKTLNGISGYRESFERVFGHEADLKSFTEAIAVFERTLISRNSAYDRYSAGQHDALSENARRGKDLFFDKFKCSTCHSGPNFTNEQVTPRCYPRFGTTEVHPGPAEAVAPSPPKGAFKTPTLRNVALSGPYLHNGSLKTLEEVIEFYNHSGPVPAGSEGRKDFPHIEITSVERADLVEFLKSLTGDLPVVQEPQLPR